MSLLFFELDKRMQASRAEGEKKVVRLYYNSSYLSYMICVNTQVRTTSGNLPINTTASQLHASPINHHRRGNGRCRKIRTRSLHFAPISRQRSMEFPPLARHSCTSIHWFVSSLKSRSLEKESARIPSRPRSRIDAISLLIDLPSKLITPDGHVSEAKREGETSNHRSEEEQQNKGKRDRWHRQKGYSLPAIAVPTKNQSILIRRADLTSSRKRTSTGLIRWLIPELPQKVDSLMMMINKENKLTLSLYTDQFVVGDDTTVSLQRSNR